MFPVAILAGGQAMRLRPVTEKVPKALLPFAGRPFIHWQLELLASQGISEVVLCVGFLGERIRDVVGDGAELGIAVRYSFDGEVLLGTGGALRRALPLLGQDFFVLYGDSYLNCSFETTQAAYEAQRLPGLMTVFRNADRWERSNVLWRDGRILEYNKRAPGVDMAHVDYGLAVLSARTLAKWPAGTVFDLADLYHELSLRGELAGLEVGERFYEIGSARGIEETARYLSARASS
jgi:N-acetyl-alpha-D-muramate 1-phosphate uridylyltransferase